MKPLHIFTHSGPAAWAAVAFFLLLAGCTKTPASPGTPGTEETAAVLTFTADIPAHDAPVSRSLTDGANPAESRPEYIDLLIFDASGSSEVFHKWYSCGDISTVRVNPANGYRSISFQARIAYEDMLPQGRLVFVVNAPGEVRDLVNHLESPGTPAGELEKRHVMEQLRVTLENDPDHGWKWLASAESPGRPGVDYFPIPMYGETEVVRVISEGRYEVAFSRMLARVDVLNTVPDFELTAIYLLNYATSGFIAPAWDLADGSVLVQAPAEPYLPGHDGLPGDAGLHTGTANAIEYGTGPSRDCVGEIYTMPVRGASFSGDPEVPCVILKGVYDGEEGYYRLDFLHYPDENHPDAYTYLPLLRNHRYIFTVTAVHTVGHPTLEDALESEGFSLKLYADLFTFDEREITHLVYNAMYYVGVGKDVIIPSGGGTYDAGLVVTNLLSGWAVDTDRGTGGVEYLMPETGTPQVDWIVAASNTGGDGASRGNLSVTVTANQDEERSAYIHLKAGNLRHKLKVTQLP